MKIAAVVFDWAGTMIDFGCLAPVAALSAAFAGHGVALSEAQLRRDMGRAKRDHVRALIAGLPGKVPDEDALMGALEPLMEAMAQEHATLIPGAADLAETLRLRGVKIGSCTGYTRQMMTGVLPLAAAQGYSPDAVVCAGETSFGRPSPLMLWRVLTELEAWPAFACVKVDDAPVGVQEGVAAGTWSVGVAASGNGVGLGLQDWLALSETERRSRAQAAAESLWTAGADFVIDTVADLPAILDEIERRLAAGERPGQASLSARAESLLPVQGTGGIVESV